MNIALMAHDNRKELMVQFCTAYCGILAKHTYRADHTPLPVLRPRRRTADRRPHRL